MAKKVLDKDVTKKTAGIFDFLNGITKDKKPW